MASFYHQDQQTLIFYVKDGPILNNLIADFEVFPWGKPYYSVGYKKQQNDLPKTKEKYPKYKAVYSKVLQMAIRTLNADYN
ncbi:MAG: hypothetical protein OIN86_08980, partial [Candidatus Methanoperedens sp.]|nr:hypothetical protein [Candidatus Methanoperedens sp.]